MPSVGARDQDSPCAIEIGTRWAKTAALTMEILHGSAIKNWTRRGDVGLRVTQNRYAAHSGRIGRNRRTQVKPRRRLWLQRQWWIGGCSDRLVLSGDITMSTAQSYQRKLTDGALGEGGLTDIYRVRDSAAEIRPGTRPSLATTPN